jgi:hypothetical protein
MPDSRPQHFHYPPSLMNQKTPPFNGAAHALYGERGPERPMRSYNRKLSGPPESIADHIDQALDRVKGLGPKARLAVHNEMVRLSQNIGYIRMVASQAQHLGPHSAAAATHMDAQGNVITG